MLLSFFLISLIAISGLALTYLIEDEEPLMWRLAAGNVIGCALYGTLTFVIACFFGLNTATAIASLGLTAALLTLLADKKRRAHLARDWNRAKGKLQGANAKKILTFCYYAFFFIVFWLFFAQAMYEMPDGIYTGGSNNLGDLPFHLGATFSFTDGGNFPPLNPSFAGAKFSYPFIADVISAGFMKLGAGVREAMFAQNFSWALSLLVLLDRFIVRLTGERSAGKIAACLLFFSGGLGFVSFVGDFQVQSSGFFQFLWHLPKDYTINDGYSWGNSLTTLFITQRSLLLGMPLNIAVLSYLWKQFVSSGPDVREEKGKLPDWTALTVGLIAGCLPLIHLHSLAVLFVVTAFLLITRPEQWRGWLSFGAGVCIVAVPELVWSLTGSASKASSFVGWHFGWTLNDENVLWFWIKNTSILIPLIIGGAIIAYRGKSGEGVDHDRISKLDKHIGGNLLLFYLPFLFCVVVANVTKLAPWEWDNIKVLIYWFVGSLPFVSIALIWIWRQNTALRVCAGICFAAMIATGSLDVWRTVSGQIKTRVFDKDAVQAAEQIKKVTPANALFLNAPTYNSAVVLTGRQSLMRFPGHLWSHGIDYTSREDDVKRMYSGAPDADALFQKYGVDYVLISPIETGSLKVNQEFFNKFPVVASSGQSRVYKIR